MSQNNLVLSYGAWCCGAIAVQLRNYDVWTPNGFLEWVEEIDGSINVRFDVCQTKPDGQIDRTEGS